MSEKTIIANTKFPITVKGICRDLKELGVNKGDTVLVHSSLSSLGWTCGGAQAVISGLQEAIGQDGSLIMPAHSGDWSDPNEWENPPIPSEWIPIVMENMPAFNPDLTPTRGMGRIAELYRTLPYSLRSNHPQVSFAASGMHAKDIVDNHCLTPQFGMESSPLGKMYALNAKVLLLGVGYDACTSFHLAETMTKAMPKKQLATALMEDGIRIWKSFEDYDYDSDDFEELGKAFEKNHKVNTALVGQATCKLFDMRAGVDFAVGWLENHRGSKNY